MIDNKNIDKAATLLLTPIVLRNGPQVPASQTDLNVARWRASFAGKIVSVHAFCRALAGTVSCDVEKGGTTQLTGNITPSAGAFVAGTLIADPSFVAGDSIELDVTTAGASSVDDLCVTVVVRPNAADEAVRPNA